MSRRVEDYTFVSDLQSAVTTRMPAMTPCSVAVGTVAGCSRRERESSRHVTVAIARSSLETQWKTSEGQRSHTDFIRLARPSARPTSPTTGLPPVAKRVHVRWRPCDNPNGRSTARR